MRTIQNHLYKFRNEGLIKIQTDNCKNDKGSFKFNRYTLCTDHYSLIDTKLITEEISRELKGFLIILKLRCFNYSNTCKYNVRGLAETLMFSKSTISRYLQEAEKIGYIKWDKKKQNIELLDDSIFIITRETKIAMLKRVCPECLTDEVLFG